MISWGLMAIIVVIVLAVVVALKADKPASKTESSVGWWTIAWVTATLPLLYLAQYFAEGYSDGRFEPADPYVPSWQDAIVIFVFCCGAFYTAPRWLSKIISQVY